MRGKQEGVYMKMTTNYPTLTYEVGGGFLISVIGNAATGTWESWLRHVNYGKATHMFSVSMNDCPLEEYVEMVENLVAAECEEYAIEYMGV